MRPISLAYRSFRRGPAKDDPHHLSVLEDRFRSQLAILAHRNLRLVDLDEYLVALDNAGATRCCLLTIDDGYASVLEIAAPILVERKHPAVLFVSPALLGADTTPERIVSPDELLELTRLGFEIGAHGFDHRELTGLSDEELRRQCADAREHLADVLGRRPRAFSYPHGTFDTRACRAVAAAGYEVAFAVNRSGGRYALPRVGVYSRDGETEFRAKVLLGQWGLQRLGRVAAPLRPRTPRT